MTHTTIQVFKIYLWNTRNLLNYCKTKWSWWWCI